MNTTLIDSYLTELTKRQRLKLIAVLEYIQSVVENATVASVFTLPGFTVDFLPICNLRIKSGKIVIHFFQKDVFTVFIDKLPELEHRSTCITIKNVDELKSEPMKELFQITARSTKVDAAFTRAIQMRDYGYYDSVLLKPKKEGAHNE